MTYTRKFAEYAFSFSSQQLSSRDMELAKWFFLDCVGCILAGSGDEPVGRMRELAREYGGKPVARTIGAGSIATDACHAAFINGISAHIRDYDDYGLLANGHLSAVLVPLLLALGEKHGTTGKALLESYVVGIKTASVLGGALSEGGYSPYWDPTGTVAVFGATSAAGRLLGLSVDQLTCAYAIAMETASGVKANYSSIVKDFAAGRSAANAILAAECARRGFACNEGVMEDQKGLALIAAPGFSQQSADRLFERDDDVFASCGMTMKMHPTCRGTHNAIDAALKLVQAGVLPNQIEEIHCEADRIALLNEKPATVPRFGKVNMAYCLALAFLNGRIVMDDFRGETVPPDALSLAGRVRIEQVEYPGKPPYTTRVTVRCKDGRVYSELVERPKGDVCDLPGAEECIGKFRACAEAVIGAEHCGRVIDAILQLEELRRISELTDLLISEESV